MITTKQKWALGGLVTLSASVWTPQIMERLGGSTDAQLGIEAGPGEDEMLSIEMGTSGTSPTSMGQPVAAALSGMGSGALSTGGNGSDVGAATAAPAGSRVIVSEVLRTLRRSEAFGVAEQAEAATLVLADEEPAMEPELPPQIFTYLESHPLRGTIVGDTLSMALIGQYRVRVGEMVPGTAATLVSVERGRATLREGGLSIELELAPLETSQALMAERQRESTGASGSNGGPGSILPGSGGLAGNGSFAVDSAAIAAASAAAPVTGQGASNTAASGSSGDF